MRKALFEFKLGQRLWLNDAPAIVCQVDSTGKRHVRLLHTNQIVTLSKAKLARFSMCGVVRSAEPAPGSQDGPAVEDHHDSGVLWHELSESQRARVERRINYVKAVEELYPIHPKNPLLSIAIMQVAEKTGDDHPPSPHSVYRWLRRYVKAGCDASALAREAAFKRRRKSRLPAGARQQLAVQLMEALGANPGASISGVFNDVMRETAKMLGLDSYKDRDGNVQHVAHRLRAKRRDHVCAETPRLS